MLMATGWILAVAVLGGVGLAGVWLNERRPAPWMGAAHGVLALVGTVLAVFTLAGAADAQGFGRMAGWFLGVALAGGAVVAVMKVLRRRPSGLVVALHATVGIAGFVLWLVYRSIAH